MNYFMVKWNGTIWKNQKGIVKFLEPGGSIFLISKDHVKYIMFIRSPTKKQPHCVKSLVRN